MAKDRIELVPLGNKFMTVKIVGDSNLVLNKMDDVTARELTDERKDKAKKLEKPNVWEKIITSMHWRDGKPEVFTEESLYECLKNNAPCITDFGLKKSWMAAVVRNKIDTYSTKFDATVNLMDKNGLCPIKFSDYRIDEMLMSPKKGKPVLSRLNTFIDWSAEIKVSYMETSYSMEQILNIINLAGFGMGIGSGKSSGNGRYHITEVKAGI